MIARYRGKNYFAEELINNSSRACGFYAGNRMWDLNYKHLHILFTLQVAMFHVVWAVGIGDFFNAESVNTVYDEFFQKTDDALDKILYIAAITIRQCSIATRKLPTNYSCEPFGGPKPCDLLVGGMTQLTAALMK